MNNKPIKENEDKNLNMNLIDNPSLNDCINEIHNIMEKTPVIGKFWYYFSILKKKLEENKYE